MHVLVLTIEWSYYVHGTNTITIFLFCLQFPLEGPSVCSSAAVFWVPLSCCIIAHCVLFVRCGCGPRTKKNDKSIAHRKCNKVLGSKHRLLRCCVKINAHTSYETHEQSDTASETGWDAWCGLWTVSFSRPMLFRWKTIKKTSWTRTGNCTASG